MRSDRLGTHEALRVDRSWAYRHDNDRTSATSSGALTSRAPWHQHVELSAARTLPGRFLTSSSCVNPPSRRAGATAVESVSLVSEAAKAAGKTGGQQRQREDFQSDVVRARRLETPHAKRKRTIHYGDAAAACECVPVPPQHRIRDVRCRWR